MKTWQGYIEDGGGRRPGHLVLYPIEVDGLVHDNNKFKNISRVSWWRSGLSARLLPGHNCSHWRNQELSPAWETDHIVFESNVFPLWRTKAIVANYKLSSYRSSEVARIRFSWIQCYSYIVSLHFFVQFTKFGMKLSPYGLSAKSLLILLRTFVLVRRR